MDRLEAESRRKNSKNIFAQCSPIHHTCSVVHTGRAPTLKDAFTLETFAVGTCFSGQQNTEFLKTAKSSRFYRLKSQVATDKVSSVNPPKRVEGRARTKERADTQGEEWRKRKIRNNTKKKHGAWVAMHVRPMVGIKLPYMYGTLGWHLFFESLNFNTCGGSKRYDWAKNTACKIILKNINF